MAPPERNSKFALGPNLRNLPPPSAREEAIWTALLKKAGNPTTAAASEQAQEPQGSSQKPPTSRSDGSKKDDGEKTQSHQSPSPSTMNPPVALPTALPTTRRTQQATKALDEIRKVASPQTPPMPTPNPSLLQKTSMGKNDDGTGSDDQKSKGTVANREEPKQEKPATTSGGTATISMSGTYATSGQTVHVTHHHHPLPTKMIWKMKKLNRKKGLVLLEPTTQEELFSELSENSEDVGTGIQEKKREEETLRKKRGNETRKTRGGRVAMSAVSRPRNQLNFMLRNRFLCRPGFKNPRLQMIPDVEKRPELDDKKDTSADDDNSSEGLDNVQPKIQENQELPPSPKSPKKSNKRAKPVVNENSADDMESITEVDIENDEMIQIPETSEAAGPLKYGFLPLIDSPNSIPNRSPDSKIAKRAAVEESEIQAKRKKLDDTDYESMSTSDGDDGLEIYFCVINSTSKVDTVDEYAFLFKKSHKFRFEPHNWTSEPMQLKGDSPKMVQRFYVKSEKHAVQVRKAISKQNWLNNFNLNNYIRNQPFLAESMKNCDILRATISAMKLKSDDMKEVSTETVDDIMNDDDLLRSALSDERIRVDIEQHLTEDGMKELRSLCHRLDIRIQESKRTNFMILSVNRETSDKDEFTWIRKVGKEKKFRPKGIISRPMNTRSEQCEKCFHFFCVESQVEADRVRECIAKKTWIEYFCSSNFINSAFIWEVMEKKDVIRSVIVATKAYKDREKNLENEELLKRCRNDDTVRTALKDKIVLKAIRKMFTGGEFKALLNQLNLTVDVRNHISMAK